jgi:V/A-type H+-transporting ATPase subunit A
MRHGKDIYQMMQVTGEEGVSLDDFVVYRKSLLLDMVFLQQDAFDDVDVSTPVGRQKESLMRLKELIDNEYQFGNKDEVRDFFTRLTDQLKNLNYSIIDSQDYGNFVAAINELAAAMLKRDNGQKSSASSELTYIENLF